MAAKKPLVLDGDLIQQLQSGDTLDIPAPGATEELTNDNAGSIVIGNVIYIKSNGNVDLAKADSITTALAFGLVADETIASAASGNIQYGGILTATTGQWDAVTGGSGGLTPGSKYYISAATAGLLTPTPPSTATQLICPLGLAISSTKLKINILRVVML